MAVVDKIDLRTENDILVARQRGRRVAEGLGFSQSELTMIATAISELTRNVIVYADHGEVEISTVRNGHKQGVRIVVADQGPGIADVELALQDGYSTGGSLGIGLPGTRRLMDEFNIDTVLGVGTTITVTKWLR